eukprot:4623335-Heterocapsa_arctica.AAC.1
MRSHPSPKADNAPCSNLNNPSDVGGGSGNILIGPQGEVQGHSDARPSLVRGSRHNDKQNTDQATTGNPHPLPAPPWMGNPLIPPLNGERAGEDVHAK